MIDRLLITSGIFQDKRKYSACDLKCRYCVFTLWGRDILTNVMMTHRKTKTLAHRFANKIVTTKKMQVAVKLRLRSNSCRKICGEKIAMKD